MITLPPPPADSIQIQTIDYEIQAPSLPFVVHDIFGIKLDTLGRILSIAPRWPSDWEQHDVALSTADFDFSCLWCDSIPTWHFEAIGNFAMQYDSLVVYLPYGTKVSGQLADTEGVQLQYIVSDVQKIIPTKKTIFKRNKQSKKSKNRKKND